MSPFRAAVLYFLLTPLYAQSPLLFQKAGVLVDVLQEFHYRGPLKFSDKLNKEIKLNFIQDLDPQGLFFLGTDVDELASIKTDLEHPAQGARSFLTSVLSRYRQRLNEASAIVTSWASSSPNFEKSDEIQFYSPHNVSFASDPGERKLKWTRLLKYRILSAALQKQKATSEKDLKVIVTKGVAEFLPIIIKREQNGLQRILNPPDGLESLVFSIFSNALIAPYDPHSRFFSAADKRKFEESLSTQAFSYGVILKREVSGDIRIARVIPGSPAWKSSKLNRDDLLVEVRSGDRDPVDLSDLSGYEIDSALNGPASDQITITVKKTTGIIDRVTLFKERLRVEDNVVNSFVLRGSSKKIGYVSLPSFYSEWENPNAPGCANDVAKEILKLQREKIDGLILDLRNNGGGSLAEAMDLAGIFIDEGPLFIQNSRIGKPVVLKDRSRGTVYDGPLAVMVNTQSASASEFFAGTMKDYNRAIIVGTPTFGKASAQIIVPLSRDNQEFLKITTNLFNNLSGKSHQLSGVTPDVFLPDISVLAPRESDQFHPLEPVKVDKTVTFQPLTEFHRKDLAELSEERVSRNEGFKRIDSLAKSLKKYVSLDQEISLRPEDFAAYAKKMSDAFEFFQSGSKHNSTMFTVDNHSYDIEIAKISQDKREVNAQLKEQILADIYIDECYRVLQDYLKLERK